MPKPETCSRCGQEVRYGRRGDFTGWLHREEVDHVAVFGRIMTPEMEEKVRLHREAVESAVDPDEGPLPPVEIYAHDVDPEDFAPRSGIRQIINLIPKQGWELLSVRHARGPYVGSKGQSLGISDSHVVKARGPARLDGGVPVAVASWRDSKFDFAYIGTIEKGHLEPRKVDSTSMKNWIKGIE
jgi:hypothetical protein